MQEPPNINYSQFEESGAQLQQQHMRQPVFMDNEDTLHCPPHSHFIKLLPHPLEPSSHRAVLLIQRLFGAECVVG